MITIIDHTKMGTSEQGWLHSVFHFSFAEYYNPDNIQFGVLRVVNDDLVEPQGGFATHPHENMEIISYVIDGELSHADSMGNESSLTRGQVQYMSAGSGITHSEYNKSKDTLLRFLQIWILPDALGYEPNYGDYPFKWDDRKGRWLLLVSGKQGSAPITINQDMKISVVALEEGDSISYEISPDRQLYLIQIEGTGSINGVDMDTRDAAEVIDESFIELVAKTPSHYIAFDMLKQE